MNGRTSSRISNLALIFFVLLTFSKFLITAQLYFEVATACLAILGIVCLLIAAGTIPRNSALHFAWSIPTVLGLVTMLPGNNQLFSSLLQTTAHIGLAIILVKSPPRLNIQSIIIALAILFFLVQIVTNTPPDEVFTVSRNFISVIVVLIVSLYFLACDEERKKPSALVPAIFLLITIWAIGRSGIASALLLLTGALLYKPTLRRIGLVLVLFASTFVAFSQLAATSALTAENYNRIGIFLIAFERFERLGTSGERDTINSEYLERVQDNPLEIVFGAPLEKIKSIVEVDGNPHNSFIRLHTSLGIFGAMIFVVMLACSVSRLIRSGRYLTLIALGVSLFRSAFDSTAFPGPLDIIIFYGLFRPFSNTRLVITGNNYVRFRNYLSISQKRPASEKLYVHSDR
jgi:hypothetical protein